MASRALTTDGEDTGFQAPRDAWPLRWVKEDIAQTELGPSRTLYIEGSRDRAESRDFPRPAPAYPWWREAPVALWMGHGKVGARAERNRPQSLKLFGF